GRDRGDARRGRHDPRERCARPGSGHMAPREQGTLRPRSRRGERGPGVRVPRAHPGPRPRHATAPRGWLAAIPTADRRRGGVMRLFTVELDRFVSRPALRWIAVAVLFLAASAALLALGPATPISESARAQAVADFEEYHAMWLTDHEAEYESCLEAEASERETFPEADW